MNTPNLSQRFLAADSLLSHAPGMAFSSADFALLQIGKYLRAQHYRFVTPTPGTHARVQNFTNEWARDLRDIFGWSKPFRVNALPQSIFTLLRSGRVLQPYLDGWRCTVRFSTLDSLLLLHSAYPTVADDAVFFGPDTYRFCTFIQSVLEHCPVALKRVVDVGCGSGAAAIALARKYPNAEVHALDINSRALQYARINAALAGVDNISIDRSDLFDAVDGAFDLIVANPPYMVDEAKRAYRHGGDLWGAEFSLALFDNALPRLRVGGSLLLYTGAAIVDGDDVFLRALQPRLDSAGLSWSYREIDPDVFGEEIGTGAYTNVERIAAVGLTVTRTIRGSGASCTH